jgi:hypothetical protein
MIQQLKPKQPRKHTESENQEQQLNHQDAKNYGMKTRLFLFRAHIHAIKTTAMPMAAFDPKRMSRLIEEPPYFMLPQISAARVLA